MGFLKKILPIIFFAFLGSCVSQEKAKIASTKPDDQFELLPCRGTYSGQVLVGKDRIVIRMYGVNLKSLSRFEESEKNDNVKQIAIFFDTDEDPAADYCIFVYSDRWSLRHESAPGYFSIVLKEGELKSVRNGNIREILIAFDTLYMTQPVKRAWNFLPPPR